MSLVILTDNDEAGHKAAEQIKNKCEKTYRIYMPKITQPDIAEMSTDEIQKDIKDFIEKII